MSREEKQQTQQAELQKQLWSIANTLRGNMMLMILKIIF